MVRRIGFGNTPKPEKPRAPRAPLPKDTQETRPMPAPPKPETPAAPVPSAPRKPDADQTPPNKPFPEILQSSFSIFPVGKFIFAAIVIANVSNVMLRLVILAWAATQVWPYIRKYWPK